MWYTYFCHSVQMTTLWMSLRVDCPKVCAVIPICTAQFHLQTCLDYKDLTKDLTNNKKIITTMSQRCLDWIQITCQRLHWDRLSRPASWDKLHLGVRFNMLPRIRNHGRSSLWPKVPLWKKRVKQACFMATWQIQSMVCFCSRDVRKHFGLIFTRH